MNRAPSKNTLNEKWFGVGVISGHQRPPYWKINEYLTFVRTEISMTHEYESLMNNSTKMLQNFKKGQFFIHFFHDHLRSRDRGRRFLLL